MAEFGGATPLQLLSGPSSRTEVRPCVHKQAAHCGQIQDGRPPVPCLLALRGRDEEEEEEQLLLGCCGVYFSTTRSSAGGWGPHSWAGVSTWIHCFLIFGPGSASGFSVLWVLFGPGSASRFSGFCLDLVLPLGSQFSGFCLDLVLPLGSQFSGFCLDLVLPLGSQFSGFCLYLVLPLGSLGSVWTWFCLSVVEGILITGSLSQ